MLDIGHTNTHTQDARSDDGRKSEGNIMKRDATQSKDKKHKEQHGRYNSVGKRAIKLNAKFLARC